MPVKQKTKTLESLDTLLREKVRKKHLTACMTDRSYNFFFVDTGEDGPSWNAKKLSDDVSKLQSSKSAPKYDAFLEVSKGNPISLEEVLKLDASLSSYVRNSAALYADNLKKDGWTDGLPKNSVVPSLYILNRTKVRSFGKNGKGQPEIPTSIFNRLMANVPEGELGTYLSKNCGSEEGLEVEEAIKNKCIDNTRTKEVRVTSVIAYGVVEFLKTKNPGVEVTVESIFTWNPRRGEGNGRQTTVLPLSNGNVLPSQGEARDYPQV